MGHRDGASCFEAGAGQILDPKRRRRAIGPVGPGDGVEMDETPALELGHPAKGEAQQLCRLGLAEAQCRRHLAS